MIAKHPKTGKDVRLLKAEGSIWKNAKTLFWLDADTAVGPPWDRWDIGVSSVGAWASCVARGFQASVMVLMGAGPAEQEWLASGAWKSCKMVAASAALLEAVGIERLAEFRIANLISLDEMINIYPYLSGPWDGTEVDARVLVATILQYRITMPVEGAKRISSTKCLAVAEPPKRCVFITQYYKSPIPKRAKEIDYCLQKNAVCRYIDEIILLNEKMLELPVTSSKIRQHNIGKRLRFNVVMKWIYDNVAPDTDVVIANSDIYMDETLQVLWSIDMSNVFFALLRWDDVEEAGQPPKLFGPRSDSQDTWVVSANSVKERKWDWSTLDFPFGQGGCDNAFTIEMCRQKFLVVNPAMNFVTHHVHNSGVRNYDPQDIVEKPVLMYVHPSGVHDLNPKLSFDETPVATLAIDSVQVNLSGSFSSAQQATMMKMLKRDEKPLGEAAYKIPIHEFSNLFQTAAGLLHTDSSILIGKSTKSHDVWAAAELSVTAACLATDFALVAHLSDADAVDPVRYMYNYLGKILVLRNLAAGAGEWLAANEEPIVEALHMFAWDKEEMPLISRNPAYEIWCKKVYAWLPQDSETITRPEVNALRAALKGYKAAKESERIVCVVDPEWVTEDFVEAMEASKKAVSCIYPSTSVSAAVAALQGASDVVVFGSRGVSTWGLFWALPKGANVHEIQSEMRPSVELHTFCAVADLKHVLHIVARSAPNKADLAACVSKVLMHTQSLPCIRVPHPKTQGFFAHAGDSFREMIDIWAERGYVVRKDCHNMCNVWLGNVMLYDRPTFEWLDASPPHEQNYDKILLGNPFDGRAKSAAWSFWPRRPRYVEELVVKGAARKSYDERPRGIVFYGKSENGVQLRKRTGQDWMKGCDEYVHVEGNKPYPFNQMEYLQRLSQSKWGLCLPGYGDKCHREIECMAMGCVPVVTPGVDVKNYAEPLKEGVHFIRVSVPEEMAGIADIPKEAWAKMSAECQAWWRRNASAEGMWRLTERLTA